MAQPEKRFKAGAVTASVFANEVKSGEGTATLKSVALQRAYMGKDGKFQNTTSFKADDIPKAILALSKAYEYLVMDGKTE